MKPAYPPDVRASVLASVLAGESVLSTARTHGIDPGTVRRWRFEAGINTALVHQRKKQEMGEQVYGFLEELIATLRLQVRTVADETWIKQQSAGELAVLIGVECDKAIRLLAAFQPRESGGDE